MTECRRRIPASERGNDRSTGLASSSARKRPLSVISDSVRRRCGRRTFHACAPADLCVGSRGYTPLTQRGSAQRFAVNRDIPETSAWPRFSIVLALLLSLWAPFIPVIRAEPQSTATVPSNSTSNPQGNETKTVVPPAAPVEQAIPLPQIADRAEELDRMLQDMRSEMKPKSELWDLQVQAEKKAADIRRRVLETREILAGPATTLELEDEQRYWHFRSLEYAEERKLLTARAAKLEEQIQTLDARQPEWMATWVQIQQSQAAGSVAERIKQQVEKIQGAKAEAQGQLNEVLALQIQVSQQDQQISELLMRV